MVALVGVLAMLTLCGNYKYSKTMSPGIEVVIRDGQRAVITDKDMPQGAMVIAALQEQVTVDGSVRKLLELPTAHHIASVIQAVEGKGEEGETPHTPLHLLKDDENLSRFALGYHLALKRAEWGEFAGGHISSTLNKTAGLYGVFQHEIRIVHDLAKSWWAVAKALGDSLPEKVTEEDLAWASVVLRAKGMASPFGEMVGEYAMFFRQHHGGCVELEMQQAKGSILVGVLSKDAPKGTELCLSYTPGPSRQQLLVQYGLWDPTASWGINYYITDADLAADPSVLAAHDCMVGEIVLTPTNFLTKQDLYCFMLHQISKNVRHNYKDLLRGRGARDEAYASLGSSVAKLLSDGYNATVEGAFDVEHIKSKKEVTEQEEEDDMPEELKQLLANQKQQQHEEVVEQEEHKQEVLTEKPAADLDPVVAQLNGYLSLAVPSLKEFHANLLEKWIASKEADVRTQEQEALARNQLVMEQARRAMEEFELSKDEV
eukprot:TRINITY_DN2517_c1_g1_i1.p1 TRINITY_DN2517_c1_g1~~TRINITY_DN2517_c1_g1_i1.p1  ORF type:complete len:502 (+),score=151.87 TRINITY_DN2517_c1_g1_i1:48-1508(+)